jgi:hypothetical protein
MVDIHQISKKVINGRFELSKHAVDQSILRGISISEIREVFAGEIVLLEDYPDDHLGPSCLVLGYSSRRRPLHFVCSYPSRPIVKFITLYEPDTREWIGNKLRR